jgi:acyl-homoserine-lactone acylase
VVVALAMLAAPVAASAEGGGLKAKITRSAVGTPTIEAKNWKGLGFGYGYAFAQDNICTIADTYLTSAAERSRWFGPDAETPEGFTNLDSDLFYQQVRDRGIVEELIAQPPPAGPKGAVEQGVEGYVEGYNRYLEKTGVENIPDPRCAGEPWVRPIDKWDVYRRFYELVLYASSGVAIDGIANAQPPAAAPRSAYERAAAATEAVSQAEREQAGELGNAFASADMGSNAWGLGSDATESGGGIVLGNPHFPWDGPRRFYQSHLVIPGKVNVSGASLFGVPLILIGHTEKLAWSHTVSTAFRFTPFELTLAPGDPTSYLVDGQPVAMEEDSVTVEVKQPDGSIAPVSRTLYGTRYGPITTSIQGQSLFEWSESTAYALFDANANNMRILNHFFEVNRAQSTKKMLSILREYQGIPWVNTIAADSKGRALYADVGSIPNVPNEKATGCSGALGQLTFPALGLPLLDGSRSECALATDADSPAEGIMGDSKMPVLERRDYVANGNDSYWLTNPEQPLEGFARIIGDEGTERSLRTRLGLKMIEQRLAGSDGMKGDKFTRNQVRRLVFQNRHYGGELLRDELAAFCRANPTLTGSAGPVDVSAACPALEGWDLRVNLDSTGALLFRRFLINLGGIPFTTPFDVADPVNTPAGLDTADPAVGTALADAVTDLTSSNIPLDSPYGEYHYELRGSERIPIHGGLGQQGVFNAIDAEFEPGVGYDDITHGSSFVMVTSFEGGCPKDRSILTYSLSDNPASEHYADQTRMFSEKQWVNPPFCPGQVERAAESVKVVRGG